MIRSLAEQFYAARRDDALVVVEGFHALKHALRFGAQIVCAVTSQRENVLALCKHHAPESIMQMDTLLEDVDATLYARLAPRPPRTGVIALARRPQYSVDDIAHVSAPIVCIDDARSLDNLGACVRVAAAYGAAGIVAIGATDVWKPACVRGSAGLHFAIPVLNLSVEELSTLGRPIYIFDENGNDMQTVVLPQKSIVVFGSERSGVSDAVRSRAVQSVRIPMQEGVSSLNLATSVAAGLYGGTYE